MNMKSLLSATKAAITVITISLALTAAAAAQYTETTLYTFPLINDSPPPSPSGLISDHAGNFYGTTNFYGSCGNPELCGTVFELSPTTGGEWTETTLYSFSDESTLGSPLAIDDAGNLYGVTYGGVSGTGYCTGEPRGCGTVFELSPSSGGWTFTTIHSFEGPDGAYPNAVILDSAGNLYGTTNYGGSATCCGFGTVFTLTHNASGWHHIILHRFTGGNDGKGPAAGLVMDASGNFYGTTNDGGEDGYGTVFKLTPNGAGGLRFGWIHAFFGGQRERVLSLPLSSMRRATSTAPHGTAAARLLRVPRMVAAASSSNC